MYKLSERYSRRRAFITGAGSGLGKALCQELAKDGWTLGITDIDVNGLAATAAEIGRLGGSALAYNFDVADSSEYEAAANDFLNAAKGVDLVVNNAGVGEGTPFEEYSVENWKWITGINQLGVIYGCHYFVPVMKRQNNGHIINIASAAGFANLPHMSPYNITKAAVISLSETLAIELKHCNVQVSVATPSFFRSGIMRYSRGNGQITKGASKIVDSSPLDAVYAAKCILRCAGQQKLFIIFPFQAKVILFVKRFSPGLYRWLVSNYIGRNMKQKA